MRKVLFSILLSMMFLGVSVSNGMAQTPPDLDVAIALKPGITGFVDETGAPGYLLNDPGTVPPEPIEIDITLENVGADDIATVKGFSDEPFAFFLRFITPDGSGVKAITESDTIEGVNPPLFFVDGELVQADQVEVLPGTATNNAFVLTVKISNAHAIYTTLAAHGAGKYSVKAIIDMRTYPSTIETTNLVELESFIFHGVIESNTVNFFLVADEDGDGYSYPVAMFPPAADPTFTADCNDNDPAINPGMVEICGNGIDDDCNPATLGAKDCCKHGKLRVLTMMYRGLDCSFTSHSQSVDKAKCTDFAPLPDTVFIIANDKNRHDERKAKIWFTDFVNLDETFDIDAANAGARETKLRSNTVVHIFDKDPNSDPTAKLLQKVNFHTSCSLPLFTCDQFGSVMVLDCIGENE